MIKKLVGCGRLLVTSSMILAFAPVPAWAQSQSFEFNIPAQSLGSALRAFARASHQQILFDGALVRNKRSAALTGRTSVEAGLARLLEGTGLRATRGSRGAYVVQPAATPQAQPSAAGQDDAVTLAGSAEGPEDAQIVVTGSRLRRFGEEGPTPVTTFAEEDIDRLGVSSVSDILNYLPQQSFSFNENFNFAGTRRFQLRGLGVGTTLVLINGRRTVTSALTGARSYFDVNTIPLPAVDRLEILSTSASAVYGADAVAGVVNIILKDRIPRPVVDLYYGFTPEGDSHEERASLSFGLSSGRFRSGFTFDYFKRTPLFGADRELTASLDFRRYGGPDARTQGANPGNVVSSTGALLPGLNASFAAVPVGSTGVGLTPASFAATAGQINLESQSRFASIIPKTIRRSAVAFAELDPVDGVTMFGEFMYVDRDDTRIQAPVQLSNALVPAANPFNPFKVPVRVNFLLTGIGVREDATESRSYRAVAGMRGDIGSWKWEVSGLLTHDKSGSFITNQLDTARVTAALASTNPATALNPFQDGPGGSPEVLRSLLADTLFNSFKSTARQLGGFASGPLFALPAGEVEVVLGGEARSEVIDFHLSGVNLNYVGRKSEAVFGEVRVPLIGPDMDIPLVDRLAVTAAARYDHYNDFGGTFNPQYGLEWIVDQNLMLRASYSTSFRPASLFELYQPMQFQAGATIIDFRRNNERYAVDVTSGGNPGLAPEDAKAFSAGVVFKPVWLSGFRFTLDYWRIQQDLRVQRFSANNVILNESTFADRLTRAAATPQDIAAGLPGRILRIDATSVNFGGLTTDGLDFKIDYDVKLGSGTLRPSLSATYVDNFLASNFPGVPPVERAGLASSEGSIPRWRATGSLLWSAGGFQLSATGRYIDSYDDVNAAAVRTGRKVSSRLIVDAQAGYTFGPGSRWLDGLDVRVGAANLFDTAPPFSQVQDQSRGHDDSLAELRQRFLYVKLSKTF